MRRFLCLLGYLAVSLGVLFSFSSVFFAVPVLIAYFLLRGWS